MVCETAFDGFANSLIPYEVLTPVMALLEMKDIVKKRDELEGKSTWGSEKLFFS